MASTSKHPPRVSLALTSGLGLGYLPFVPGTWGSLGSVALYILLAWGVPQLGHRPDSSSNWSLMSWQFLTIHLGVIVFVSLLGVWTSTRAARHIGTKDPGIIVIDEVAGQQIAYFGLPFLDWRFLLAGFLLFRAFDIWKPFPARQAESWPEGWGIMADDWFAGLYAALVLLLARHFDWLGTRLSMNGALYWTALVVALSPMVWAALRNTRWRPAAGWIALALAGQACSLQLLAVGPQVRLQMFFGWGDLLRSYRAIFLVALLVQAAIVLWGARPFWPEAKSKLSRLLGWPAALFFLALEAYGAISIAPGVAQALVGTGFARQALAHASKAGLGLLVFGVGALNLALAAATIPSGAWDEVVTRWQRTGRARLPWLCALWVIAVSSLLAWVALNRIPHLPDEAAYLFEAKYISAGHIYLPPPPEPGAFAIPFQTLDAGKWYNAMPAGWSFVLAVGVWFGVPWLINPLLGGIAILLSHSLIRILYDRDTADATVLLLACSPWLLFLSASLLTHPLSLVLSLLCVLGVAHARRSGSAARGMLGGLGAGALLHVRPLEAVIIAGVAGLYWLSAGWRKLRLTSLAAACLAGLVMAGLFLAYNKTLSGDPLVVPINKFFDKVYYPGANRLGFGRDIGNFGWAGLDALPGHGPIDVVMNTNQNLYLLNFEEFGWACGSLLFALLMLAWGRLRQDALMWGWIFALLGAMSLYWFSGGPDFGPRYWYQLIVPVAVLTVRGAQTLAAKLGESGAAPDAGWRVWSFLALASVLGFVNVIPWRCLDKYHNYRDARPDIRNLEKQYDFGHSLVVIRGRQWPDYSCAVPFDPPVFDREVPGPIYALDLGAETTARLRSYYSGRPLWILAGPSVTGRGFDVIQGPLPPEKTMK